MSKDAARKPCVGLVDRAVHPYFLLQLCATQADVPGKGRVALGDMTVAEVVYQYVKQATEDAACDYIQAIHRTMIRNAWSRDGRFRQDMEASPITHNTERQCKDKPLNGRTTYFVSHCWAYKFRDLVNLVMKHYDAQPGTSGGLVYQPLYYWVDIFAVFQNFKGDFKDHPDSDFPGVIRSSQGVLFTIMPWRAPLCVERVWCLFEALQAVSAHVPLDLLVEDVQSGQTLDKLQQLFTKVVVDSLDIRKCKATVEADKRYILTTIEKSLSIDRFNTIMRDALKKQVMQVMLITAVQQNDLDSAVKMIKSGVTVAQRVLSFSGNSAFDGNDKGLKALAEVVKVSHAIQALTINTTASCKAGHEGFAALMTVLKTARNITDLTISKPYKDNLKLHDEGWVKPKSATAIGEVLAENKVLRRLDLSRQIKMGPTGLTAIAKSLMNVENSALQELILAEVGGDAKSVALVAEAVISGALPCTGDLGVASSSFSMVPGRSGVSFTGGVSPLQQRVFRGAAFASALGNTSMSVSSGQDAAAAAAAAGSPARGGTLGMLAISRPSPLDLLGERAGGSAPGSGSSTPTGGSGGRLRLPLQRLDLSLNVIGEADGSAAAALGKMLSKAPTIQALHLRACGLGSGAAKSLAGGLGEAASLTHLDLSGNAIGDDGVTALSNALKKNGSLKQLLLGACGISASGAQALGMALSLTKAPVAELSLRDNPSIGNGGAAAVGQAIRTQGKGSFMRRVSLANCGISGKDGVAGLTATLATNRSLQEIDLEGNVIRADEANDVAKALGDALRSNATLTKLVVTKALNGTALALLLEKLRDSGNQHLEVIK